MSRRRQPRGRQPRRRRQRRRRQRARSPGPRGLARGRRRRPCRRGRARFEAQRGRRPGRHRRRHRPRAAPRMSPSTTSYTTFGTSNMGGRPGGSSSGSLRRRLARSPLPPCPRRRGSAADARRAEDMSHQTRTGPLTVETFREAIREAFERGLATLIERAVSETRRRGVASLPLQFQRPPRRGTQKQPPSDRARRGARRASSRPETRANRRERLGPGLLAFAGEKPGCSASEIARTLGVSEDQAERAITRLVATGRLARTVRDGRTVYDATPPGHLAPGLPRPRRGGPARRGARGSGLADSP
jgi:hypothetical protein